MRLLQLAAAGSLLLASPLLGRAQTTATTPRYYVGLAAYSSYYQKLGGQPLGTTGFRVPLQLTVGYQLRPRLAVQLGVAYSGNTDNYGSEGYVYNFGSGASSYYQYSGASTVRTTSVSVLARYTLTRNLAHRLQFDALGGLGLEHRSGYDRGTQADSLIGSLQTTPYASQGSQTSLLLSAGLGTRYRLSPRFELSLDLMANYNLPTASPSRQVLGLTSSTTLGLRYRFGK